MIAVCLLAMLMAIASAPDAQAQGCTANTIVRSSVELDAAIDCYNQQVPVGNHTITLDSSILYDFGAPFISQTNSAFGLTINGQGNTIQGPGADTIPDFNFGLLVVQGAGRLALNAVRLVDSDAFPLYVDESAGEVTVNASTFADNGLGLTLLGGSVSVAESVVSGSLAEGMIVFGGTLQVTESTIARNVGRGLVVVDGTATASHTTFNDNGFNNASTEGGTLVVSNSVITNYEGLSNAGVVVSGGSVVVSNTTITRMNSSAVWIPGGVAHVSNSTIVGNGAGVDQDGGPEGTGVVTISSLVLVDNGADNCRGTVTLDGPSYVQGPTCGPGSVPMFVDSLGEFGSNGGRTETIPLLPTSNALGGGDCTQVPVGFDVNGALVRGDLTTDQRGSGFPRTLGANCDPGSFEAPIQTAFGDVNQAGFYADAVTFAAARGITQGTSDTTFSPTAIVTRGQMATFLWRLSGEPQPTEPNPFNDVPADAFFATAVQWLAETGITQGTSPTTFSPRAPLTRGQMATFLWRLADEPQPSGSSPFTDVPPDAFFATAVEWMADRGITTGTSPTTFSPKNQLPRSQAVTFIHRLLQVPES